MHFTVIQVVATLVAFLAQFSRIFAATKPFWGKLPAVVQIWLPPVIPFAAALQAQIVGATTWTDFAVAVLVSSALLLPGAPSNRSSAPMQSAKAFPPNYPMGPMGGLLLITCFASGLLGGCAIFGSGGSFWPKVSNCAPSPASLVSQATDVLLAGGDYEAALKELALRDGAAAVECAVAAAVDSLKSKVGSRSDVEATGRGKAFLAKVSQ